MTILQIEHPVFDFEAWKAGFEGDPSLRAESRMQRYRILRPADDPKYVIIDCEFATTHDARMYLDKIRARWKLAIGTIIDRPRARMALLVDMRTC